MNMRTIRIVAEGILNEIYDTTEIPLEEATKEITRMMKSDKVVTILGINSSITVRPSTVSAVTIFDDKENIFVTTSDGMKDPKENTEQKTEAVDEITDA